MSGRRIVKSPFNDALLVTQYPRRNGSNIRLKNVVCLVSDFLVRMLFLSSKATAPECFSDNKAWSKSFKDIIQMTG